MENLLGWLLEQVPVIIVMGIGLYSQHQEKKRILGDLKDRNDYIIERDKQIIEITEKISNVLENISRKNATKSDIEGLESAIKVEITTLKSSITQ